MVQMITDTYRCKAWQNKSGKTTVTIEITREGITVETYTQPAKGYYNREHETISQGYDTGLSAVVWLSMLEDVARPAALAAISWLAQQNMQAQDSIASLFGATLFD